MSDEDIREDAQEDEVEGKPRIVDSDLDEETYDVEWVGDEDWDEIEEDEDEMAIPDGPQFVDNGDDTISDAHYHLMWKRSDSYADFGYGINWFESNDYIEELNEKKFAGYDDWRLCSFDEAKKMFSFSVSNKDKDGAEVHIDPMFKEGGGHNTWTYEEKPDFQQYAMIFSYITGNEKWEHKDNEFCHVRAIRDEIKEDWEPAWRTQSKKFDDTDTLPDSPDRQAKQ